MRNLKIADLLQVWAEFCWIGRKALTSIAQQWEVRAAGLEFSLKAPKNSNHAPKMLPDRSRRFIPLQTVSRGFKRFHLVAIGGVESHGAGQLVPSRAVPGHWWSQS